MKIQLSLLYVLLSLASCISFKPKNSFKIEVSSPAQALTVHHLEAIKNRLAPSSKAIKIEAVGNNQAYISLKTKTTEEHIRTLLKTPGAVAFYETASIKQIMPSIIDLYNEELDPERDYSIKHFKEVFVAGLPNNPTYIGLSNVKDTALVNRTLHSEKVKVALQKENLNVTFAWGIPETNGVITLYALILDSSGKPAMHGNFITRSTQSFSQVGEPTINIAMTDTAATAWETLTTRAARDRFAIAIVIDNQVYAAPMANQPITGGQTEISGNFTVESAHNLTQVISTGVIPQLEITSFITNGD
ncbi:SecDF P1 head subdomain-containing protein [Dokdonia sp. Asnod2-E02]|uniref:SecDF P1 head subdomain-containing protein n=1 Tax=Dokdonia sp. Asnod2-E02 TaxID=3160574 RepID=UPI0038647E31